MYLWVWTLRRHWGWVRQYSMAAAVFAVVIGQTQVLLQWGQSPAEFAADSDATLKVAGYAFAIWGIIYLGLLIYAVRQVLLKSSGSPLRDRLGWPSALALTGIGVWIVAAAYDWEWATIGLIFGSRNEVELIERYHAEPDQIPEAFNPLFAERSLFRD